MSETSSPATDEGEPFGYVVVDPASPGETTRPPVGPALRRSRMRRCRRRPPDPAGRRPRRVAQPPRDPGGPRGLARRGGRHLQQRCRGSTASASSAPWGPAQQRRPIQVGSHVLEFRSAVDDDTEAGERRATGDRLGRHAHDHGHDRRRPHQLLDGFGAGGPASPRPRRPPPLPRASRSCSPNYKGTLVDYVGDAFFASWELDVDPSAAANALRFALAADEVVAKCTAGFDLRYADGTPLRMGWGASIGPGRHATHARLRRHGAGRRRQSGLPDLEHCRTRGTPQHPRHRIAPARCRWRVLPSATLRRWQSKGGSASKRSTVSSLLDPFGPVTRKPTARTHQADARMSAAPRLLLRRVLPPPVI